MGAAGRALRRHEVAGTHYVVVTRACVHWIGSRPGHLCIGRFLNYRPIPAPINAPFSERSGIQNCKALKYVLVELLLSTLVDYAKMSSKRQIGALADLPRID